MSAIHFVARDAVGNYQQGTVFNSQFDGTLDLASGSAVSLNMRRLDVTGYLRQGDDLVLMMADGRKILLENYFGPDGNPQADVYLNEGGYLIATQVSATGEVSHAEAETWGKYGDLSALTFPDDPVVVAGASYSDGADAAVEQVLADSEYTYSGTEQGGDNPTMLAGFGLAPLAGIGGTGTGMILGASALGGALLFSGNGSSSTSGLRRGGGTGGSGGTTSGVGSTIVPAIDRADDDYSFNGRSEKSVTITGVAEPNSEIEVQIGGKTVTTRSDGGGKWSAEFKGDNFPGDGGYKVTVTVTEPDGKRTELDGQDIVIDTTPPDVDVSGYNRVTGQVVNAVEHNAGFSLVGTGEAGASVTLEVNGITRSTTISQNGTWSIDFAHGDLPTGEYDVNVLVTATDAYGNANTITHTITIDTVAPDVQFDAVQASDNTINRTEAGTGIDLTGMAEPGSAIEVKMGGNSYTTTATSSGSWTVTVPSSDISSGDYTATLTVTATDAAGNVNTAASTIRVDTDGAVTINPGTGAGGEVVFNSVTQASTLQLTGTTEPGSTVTVEVQGSSYTATVGAGGAWTAVIPGGGVSSGEYTTQITVNATDRAGNTTSTTGTLLVDTQNTVSVMSGFAGSDGVINGVEAAGGVTFTGMGEPGASVSVMFQGQSHSATVSSSGAWSATFAGGEIPTGVYQAPLTVVSTDIAGNTSSATELVSVDTFTSVQATIMGTGADGVLNGAESVAGLTLSGLAEPGAQVSVTLGGATRSVTAEANGSWSLVYPNGTIPGGEYAADVTVTARDAAGNTATATTTIDIDTVVSDFAFTNSPTGGDGVIAGSEAANGLTITGSVESGAQVRVVLGGVTRIATVDPDGSWTATFEPGVIPGGEYDTTLSVHATDAAGNTSTLTEAVRIDTEAGDLSLSPAAIEIDDIVNAGERADGVVITGTATPGLLVTVGLGAATTTTVAAGDGSWSANFPASQIPAGTYKSQITASITDGYGNSKSVSDTVNIDTLVTNFTSDGVTDANGLINAAEAADGITLTGTVEPGSVVSVKMGLVTHTASVDAAGNWSVDFTAGETPSGEQSVGVVITATDRAGNTAMLTDQVVVDTEVNRLAISGPVAGDGAINAQEAALGLTLTGVVEAGSSVTVDLDGTARAASVDGAGNWSVGFTAGEIGSGERDLDITVSATDAAGNTRVETDTVELDTVAPEAAHVTAFNRSGDTLRGFSVDAGDATAELSTVALNGAQGSIGNVQFDNPVAPGEVDFYFTQPLPNGSHLVITKTDGAGNESATLFALDQGLPDAVNLSNPGLNGHEIEAVDLRFAEDSTLTIDSDLLEGLSGNSNTLTVHGSADDEIAIDTTNGATLTDTNQHVTIGSDLYSIYTLGDEGGTLIIDDDITITT
ncbi:Ig-like domain-containing protein [Maritimibacter sp. UBA3975]|uniref:Ig-like domain-containing protein n=1 Tax=Maritimibacter sp. UBA3975 TaxID=1946833 RepID=UPI000C0AC687|nr:Ig-like domain-containing protein [Maritimibacter sp. UBA3975]MAM63597.1 hypothetical protein [Maritimibacter sp.]|tara:strand:- start:4819 stop:8994 length:4176 start_codon:yes stop_codon:yes gene_type:complete